MSNDLIVSSLAVALPADHRAMLADIAAWKPAIDEANRNFGKRQSQFMDRVLTVSHPTPIRNIRQCLAEIESAMNALRENHYRLRRAQVEANEARNKAKSWFISRFTRAQRIIDAEEKEAGIASSSSMIGGCVRRIAGHLATYKALLDSIGVATIDEVDFENEEERYHIAKAFEQALCAARSHGGVVDEGNHIYFYQIGINGAVAQKEVSDYLTMEMEYIRSGKTPGPELAISWVASMADKFAGCAQRVLNRRGAGPLLAKSAAIQHERT